MIKPCPNPECGSVGATTTKPRKSPAFAYCINCGMTGPEAATRSGAAHLWNALPRREDCQQAQKDALTLAEALWKRSVHEHVPVPGDGPKVCVCEGCDNISGNCNTIPHADNCAVKLAERVIAAAVAGEGE